MRRGYRGKFYNANIQALDFLYKSIFFCISYFSIFNVMISLK